MELNGIQSISSTARVEASVEALKIAAEVQSRKAMTAGVEIAEAHPAVVSSRAFSPAIYAQAAQYQLYTQSGALATLIGVPPSLAVNKNAFHDDPDAVKAVEGIQGSGVDLQA